MEDKITHHRLFVGGLFDGITKKDLTDRFERFGQINSVDIRCRKDDSGDIIKTFAYLDTMISNKNYRNCLSTFNKTKWKGNELQIQIAKESVMDRLKREREAAKEEPKAKVVVEEKKPVDLYVKGVAPGAQVEGKEQWVVGKYGRALPVVHIRSKNRKKVVTVDPSKYVHAVKLFDHKKNSTEDTEPQTSVDKLTWEMDVEETDTLKKIKGQFPASPKRKTPKKTPKRTQSDSETEDSRPSKLTRVVYNSSSSESDNGEVRSKDIPDKTRSPVSAAKPDKGDILPRKRKRTLSATSTPEVPQPSEHLSPDVSMIHVKQQKVSGTPLRKNTPSAHKILGMEKKVNGDVAHTASPVNVVNATCVKKSPGKGSVSKPSKPPSSSESESEDEQVTSKVYDSSSSEESIPRGKPKKPSKETKKKITVSPRPTLKEQETKPVPNVKSAPPNQTLASKQDSFNSNQKSLALTGEKQPGKKTRGKKPGTPQEIKIIHFDEDIGEDSDDEDDSDDSESERKPKRSKKIANVPRVPPKAPVVPQFAQVGSVDEFGVGMLVDKAPSDLSMREERSRSYNRGGYSSDEDLLDAVSAGRKAKLERLSKFANQRAQYQTAPEYTDGQSLIAVASKVYNSDSDEDNNGSVFTPIPLPPSKFSMPETQKKTRKVKLQSSDPKPTKKTPQRVAPTKSPSSSESSDSDHSSSSEEETSAGQSMSEKPVQTPSVKKSDALGKTIQKDITPKKTLQKEKVGNSTQKSKVSPVQSSPSSSSDSDSSESEADDHVDTQNKIAEPENKLNNIQKKENSSSPSDTSSESSDSDSKEEDTIEVKELRPAKKEGKSNIKPVSSKNQDESSEESDSDSESEPSDSEENKDIKPKVNNTKPEVNDSNEDSSSESSNDSEDSDDANNLKQTKQVNIKKKISTPSVSEESKDIKPKVNNTKPEVNDSSDDSSSESSSDSENSDDGTLKKTKQDNIKKEISKPVTESPIAPLKAEGKSNTAKQTAKEFASSVGLNLSTREPEKVADKGTSKPASISKTPLTDNEKRIESLKQRAKAAQDQKKLIQQALSAVDSKTQSKKIVFDSDSEEEESAKPVEKTVGKLASKKSDSSSDSSSEEGSSDSESSEDSDVKDEGKEKKSNKRPVLFDGSEESDDEDDEERFKIKPQFEGPAGEKLMSLQRRFGSDPRFKVTEAFLNDEDVKEAQGTEKESDDAVEDVEMETVENERERALEILKGIVGPKGAKKEKTKQFRDIGNIRYDPTTADHEQFEVKNEEKPKKKKKKVQEVAEEVPMPDVSKDRFFKVETSLKDTFSSTDQPFSLLAMLGRDADDSKQQLSQADGKGEEIAKIKMPWQDRFGGDDSDDEGKTVNPESEEKSVEKAKDAPPKANVTAVAKTFFFQLDDKRIKDGIEFFQQPEDMESVREQWVEERHELIEGYRHIRKRMRFRKQTANAPGGVRPGPHGRVYKRGARPGRR